jgi:hypothetical protein
LAHPARNKQRKRQATRLFGKFKYNAVIDSYTCPQEETLKPQEGGIKKWANRTKWYQFKIQNPSLQGMFRKTSLYH